MPARPVVPGVIKVELLWSQDGIPAANVLYASYTGGAPTETDLAGVASALATDFWTLATAAFWSTETTFVGIRLTDLSSDTGAVAEHAMGDTGTNVEGVMPAQACVLVNYSISRRYRGGHPRTYFPAPAFGYMDGPAAWTGAFVSGFSAQVGELYSDLASVSSGALTLTGHVNVSYVTADAPRVDPIVDPITGYVVNGIVATQRRRIRASSY